jgi:tetratricopeptide (TPR) repeat protein
MSTATDKSYRVVTLDEIESGDEITGSDDGRVRLGVRQHLDITAFGVNAFRATVEGGKVINEHDETGGLGSSGQEELYVVLNGAATFSIDGESVEAPAGSFVFVGDPTAKRGAVATEAGTTVLAIGSSPGEGYRVRPPETQKSLEAYNAGDFEKALALVQQVLAREPDDVLSLFNAACFEARLGRTDDALEHLRRAIEADERAIEQARGDEDFDSIRDDPRFKQLVP